MTNNEKHDRLLAILKNTAVGLADNLWRIEMSFRHLGEDGLGAEYGESGRTCREVLAAAQREVDEINEIIEFVRAELCWVEK